MDDTSLTRREFIRLQLHASTWLALGGTLPLSCNRRTGRDLPSKVLVLGLDGMDPELMGRMLAAGRLPSFARLARQGHFGPLATSTPPQSPVAWSNFIAGADPGGHGIFDFIHRDPATYLPYLSMSKTEEAQRSLTLGDYVIPLSTPRIHDLRRGRAFWEVLEEHDIPATVFRMPSNFPPTETRQRTLAGMGTPDILGTPGIFSYFTDKPMDLDPDIGGGKIYRVQVENDTVKAHLVGPRNTFLKKAPRSRIDFVVYRDAQRPLAKIAVQGRELLLREGDWSDWVPVSFPMIPTVSTKGICRFYLKQVRPDFKLYVTPINIDPSDPALPISTPEDYAQELYRHYGYFHTKGLPADTMALDHGVLDEGEFLALDDSILGERLALCEYELSRFEAGLLFLYVSSTDQRSHMFWRLTDPEHPAYDPKLARPFGLAIENIYLEMDRFLDRTLSKLDDRTLVLVLSDHGFSPFYRSFHLNSWLKEAGYLELRQESRRGQWEFFRNVDWRRTRAYALGFNALYVNQQGREARGSVPASEKDALVEEIASRLEQVTDPLSGQRAIARAYRTSQIYSPAWRHMAPDIIVGYNRGYRASWQTALGKVPKGLFETNEQKWSGDHCMASDVLPGILLANRPLLPGVQPGLADLTTTLLAAFGIERPEGMTGRRVIQGSRW